MPDRLTTKPMPSRCPQNAERPGWHGPCHKGHAVCVRALRRVEAQRRQAACDARKAGRA